MGSLTLAEQDRLLADPNPLYFRYSQIQGGNACAEHTHPWGQLSLISLGVMVVEVGGERLVAPPDYLIWVPAKGTPVAGIDPLAAGPAGGLYPAPGRPSGG